MDLLARRDECLRKMHEAGANAKELGLKWARANGEYEAAKWETIVRLKAEGFPSTLISAGVKGHPDVNPKMVARDMAAVDYKSEQDAEQDFKKSAAFIEDQIKREWSAAKELY